VPLHRNLIKQNRLPLRTFLRRELTFNDLTQDTQRVSPSSLPTYKPRVILAKIIIPSCFPLQLGYLLNLKSFPSTIKQRANRLKRFNPLTIPLLNIPELQPEKPWTTIKTDVLCNPRRKQSGQTSCSLTSPRKLRTKGIPNQQNSPPLINLDALETVQHRN
jgi:hypothetical protein